MQAVIRRLKERIEYIETIIQKKKSALKSPIPGYIRVKQKGNHTYFDYVVKKDGSVVSQKYLHTGSADDMRLARVVTQKGYDAKVLASAEKELKILRKLIGFYEQGRAEDIYPALSEARRTLITPIRMTDEEYAGCWQAGQYKRKTLKEGVPAYETKRGDLVRSKSEVFIADELYAHGIPYRYEYPVELTDHVTKKIYTAHPDFTILEVRSRKVYLWEHFGRMDDPGYAADSIAKLIDYEMTGYHIGEEMILTCETLQDPLTPARIRSVIKHYLA